MRFFFATVRTVTASRQTRSCSSHLTMRLVLWSPSKHTSTLLTTCAQLHRHKWLRGKCSLHSLYISKNVPILSYIRRIHPLSTAAFQSRENCLISASSCADEKYNMCSPLLTTPFACHRSSPCQTLSSQLNVTTATPPLLTVSTSLGYSTAVCDVHCGLPMPAYLVGRARTPQHNPLPEERACAADYLDLTTQRPRFRVRSTDLRGLDNAY